jgi:hypothetical protein
MPLIQPTIFAPAACYVGDQTSGAVLTQVGAIRSSGFNFSETQPGTYLEVAQNEAQSGRHQVTFDLTFISDDPNVVKIARGLSLSAGSINAVPTKNMYTVLILSPNAFTQTSYLFYFALPTDSWKASYRKDDVAAITTSFLCQSRDINTQLFFKDTYQNLASQLGSRSPI